MVTYICIAILLPKTVLQPLPHLQLFQGLLVQTELLKVGTQLSLVGLRLMAVRTKSKPTIYGCYQQQVVGLLARGNVAAACKKMVASHVHEYKQMARPSYCPKSGCSPLQSPKLQTGIVSLKQGGTIKVATRMKFLSR